MDAIRKMIDERNRLAESLNAATAQQRRLAEQAEAINLQLSEIDAALRVIKRFDPQVGDIQAIRQALDVKVPSATISKKEAMLKALRLTPGDKVRKFVEIAVEKYGVEIAVKTGGNLLWQLKQDGLARRDGQRWFPVVGGETKENAPPASANGALS